MVRRRDDGDDCDGSFCIFFVGGLFLECCFFSNDFFLSEFYDLSVGMFPYAPICLCGALAIQACYRGFSPFLCAFLWYFSPNSFLFPPQGPANGRQGTVAYWLSTLRTRSTMTIYPYGKMLS